MITDLAHFTDKLILMRLSRAHITMGKKSSLQFIMIEISKAKVKVMVFNAIFNDISVKSEWSVLLVEETGVL